MKNLIALKDLDTNDFVVKWRITKYCNVHCSYCIRHEHPTFSKEDIEKDELKLCEVAKKLSDLVERTPFNNVKIDLIGGEVSIFDLRKILSNLTTKKLKRINMTTNLIKSADYYVSLAEFLKAKGIEFTVTASFHYEFQSAESYFVKVKRLIPLCKLFVCEMVSTDDNQIICKNFIKECEALNVDYMVESDLRLEKTGERENYISVVNKKFKNPRYHAYFSDGSEKIYGSRNSFLCDKSIDINVMQNRVNARGWLCTNSWNYIYVDFNFIRGKTDEKSDCRQIIQLEDFNIVKPSPCHAESCTICGHMSLYKNKELMNDDIFC